MRILGRCSDENDQPFFDCGKERVLLGFVEPVHLIEEEDRACASLTESVARRRNLFTYVFD